MSTGRVLLQGGVCWRPLSRAQPIILHRVFDHFLHHLRHQLCAIGDLYPVRIPTAQALAAKSLATHNAESAVRPDMRCNSSPRILLLEPRQLGAAMGEKPPDSLLPSPAYG